MSDGQKKLIADLEALHSIAENMAYYLRSDRVFAQGGLGAKVPPSIEGYLLRHHRLSALQDSLLDDEQRARLQNIHTTYTEAISANRPAYQQKGPQAFAARLRQWEESLNELLRDTNMAFYRTDVEKRAMLEHLFHAAADEAFTLDLENVTQLERFDQTLERRWRVGDFIWPAEWQPAYPSDEFWWLYGSLQ